MSEPAVPVPPPAADDLQFTTVEPVTTPGAPAGAPVAPGCVACKRPITDVYYSTAGKLVCPRCRDAYMVGPQSGSAAGRLGRATAFGIGGGLLGALIWYAVNRITGYQVGLVAIVVGFLVGASVRAGSKGRGGLGYQFLAVAITYCSICAAYLPAVLTTLHGGRHENLPPAIVAVMAVIFTLAVPFLMGFKNLIGLLIVGFALWEAWKINMARRVQFSGPFRVGGAAPAALGASAPRAGA